jgi:RNA polymerase sigma-70 factor (ECF subfamily)
MQADSAPQFLSDEQLAIQAQAGLIASFERLVGRVQVPLVHFLIRRTRCPADAEDLAQDALVRAYRNLASYSPKWRFRTWLFTIAHRLSINWAQRSRRERKDPAVLEAAASNGPEPSELLVAEEGRRSLWDAAARWLEKDEVSALWLHYVEELSTAEVARVLGRSRMAVKTMLFRARKRLLPHVRAFVEIEPDESLPGASSSEVAGETLKVANV